MNGTYTCPTQRCHSVEPFPAAHRCHRADLAHETRAVPPGPRAKGLTLDGPTALRALVPAIQQHRKRHPWPPRREWPILLEGRVNSEAAPNKRGEIIRTAGLWSEAGPLPADVGHVEALTVGEVGEFWRTGTDAWVRIVAPARGVDPLVDEVRALIAARLAAARPLYLSMTTTEHLTAGATVLRARLIGVSIMLEDRPAGVPGAAVYGDGGAARGLTPATARLAAEMAAAEERRLEERWRWLMQGGS
jgi:hypothetical protein